MWYSDSSASEPFSQPNDLPIELLEANQDGNSYKVWSESMTVKKVTMITWIIQHNFRFPIMSDYGGLTVRRYLVTVL